MRLVGQEPGKMEELPMGKNDEFKVDGDISISQHEHVTKISQQWTPRAAHMSIQPSTSI